MARSKNNELRQKILSVAFEMFYEDGVDGVLMKDVAEKCDISVSLLHHYFRRKEDMLIHIFYDMVYKTYCFVSQELSPDLSDKKEYTVVFYGYFFQLFYDILTRENNKLLEIYTAVLYNASLLKNATDFAIDLLAELPELTNTPEKRLGIYIMNGSLSQLVNIYLNNPLSSHMYDLVNNLLRSYYASIGFDSEQQQELICMIDTELTDEIKEKCYRKYMANMPNFINCEW